MQMAGHQEQAHLVSLGSPVPLHGSAPHYMDGCHMMHFTAANVLFLLKVILLSRTDQLAPEQQSCSTALHNLSLVLCHGLLSSACQSMWAAHPKMTAL